MFETRPARWYVDNFGKAPELSRRARQAQKVVEEAIAAQRAADDDARHASHTTEIFEGFPLRVVEVGLDLVEVSSAANTFWAKAYESQRNDGSGKWLVRIEHLVWDDSSEVRQVRSGGDVFHLGQYVEREQAVEEAKRWVAFQQRPAVLTQ